MKTNKSDSLKFLLSLNLKENIKTLYAISNNVENNYEVFKIKKRNGEYRTIYAPKPKLKKIQRLILKNILEQMPISNYAKAYHKNISIKDNVLEHVNQKIVVKLDIKEFFDNITFNDVLKYCFSYNYFPNDIAILLTKLCTYYDYVPQGAPTSSYISNLVLKDFDIEISKYTSEYNIAYTRYADDLTFSGDFDYQELIKLVEANLLKRGFLLNKKKIRVIKQNKRQVVTGIVVNELMQTPINYRKKIRQELYYINKYGIDSHLKRLGISNKEKYLMSLKGKIDYCLQINPQDNFFQLYKKFWSKDIKDLN